MTSGVLQVFHHSLSRLHLWKKLGASLLYLDLILLTSLAADQARPDKNLLPPAAGTKVDFKLDIQPILSTNCYACHNASTQMSGLRLDNRDSALRGGYSGVVIKPGNSAESKLIQMVAGVIEGKIMPPAGERLPPEQIGLL